MTNDGSNWLSFEDLPPISLTSDSYHFDNQGLSQGTSSKNQHFLYAVATIPKESSDEDRTAAHLSNKISTFGVFDGHFGKFAAELCSTRIHEEVTWRFNNLLERSDALFEARNLRLPPNGENTANDPCNLTESEKRDALFCEAIRSAYESMHSHICKTSDSGTTAVSLHLHFNKEDDSWTAYCANIGDSRCVMLNCVDISQSNEYNLKQQPFSNIISSGFRASAIDSDPQNSSCHSNFSNQSHDESNGPISQSLVALQSNIIDDPNEKTVGDVQLTLSQRPSVASSIDEISSVDSVTGVVASGENKVTSSGPSCKQHQVTKTKKSKYLTTVHLMSEDHNLNLARERERIENKTSPEVFPLPANASFVHLPSVARGMTVTPVPRFDPAIVNPPIRILVSHSTANVSSKSLQRNNLLLPHLLESHSIFQEGNGYPSRSKLDAAQSFLCSIYSMKRELKDDMNTPDCNPSRYISEILDSATTPSPHTASVHPPALHTKAIDPINIVHKESFIMRRQSVTSSGVVLGPEALCSRQNISIMMTRSVGDRYGPRSCVPIPEVSSYTIAKDTHTRFILASDGFWDVVSIETVRSIGMNEKNRDPRDLASALAHKAHRRRTRDRTRMDDISVLVVDVNPGNIKVVRGKNGGLTSATQIFRGDMEGHTSAQSKQSNKREASFSHFFHVDDDGCSGCMVA